MEKGFICQYYDSWYLKAGILQTPKILYKSNIPQTMDSVQYKSFVLVKFWKVAVTRHCH
jgi:hypothetical protein